MKIFVGVLYTLFPEIFLLIVALFFSHYAAEFPNAGILSTELASLFILIAALALSIQFNRSRMFFALLTLLTGYSAVLLLATGHSALSIQILDGSLCLFLPFNLVYIQAMDERGIFTRYGAIPFGILLLEVVFVIALIAAQANGVAGALYVKFVRSPLLDATAISQPGLLLLAIGLLWLNDRLIRRHSAELAAFFFSLVAVAILLHARQAVTTAIFLAASALGFGLAIVVESWTMAYLDELTSLPGRRALEEQMRQISGHFVIAMLDIDHFKQFNDTYGHDVGDQVLRLVASRLQQGPGKAFRYGGEEFCVLYPGKNLKDAAATLEVLRTDIETSGFNPRRGERRANSGTLFADTSHPPLRVTVSIGAAENESARQDPWAVLHIADRALYHAKYSGRNRVCLHGT